MYASILANAMPTGKSTTLASQESAAYTIVIIATTLIEGHVSTATADTCSPALMTIPDATARTTASQVMIPRDIAPMARLKMKTPMIKPKSTATRKALSNNTT